MKIKGYENIQFDVTTYADMFQRKAVLYTTDGECYADLTINIPQYSLDEGEAFLSADCPKLIAAMVKYGYLEITGKIKAKHGIYKVGRFTQKFVNEFEKAM